MRKSLIALALAFQAAVLPLNQALAQDQAEPAPSAKGQVSLVVSGASYHIGQRSFWDNGVERHWNEVNPGAGVEYRLNDRFHLVAGFYKNSIYKLSTYAGVGVETNGDKLFGVGIEAGLVTGYEIPVIPSAVPYLRFGARDSRLNVKLEVIPPIKGLTPAVVALQARFKIG